MRITLTHYGRKEILLLIDVMTALAGLSAWLWPKAVPWPQIAAAILLLAGLAFFRDPERRVPNEPGILLAPADGKITDITEIDENEFLNGKAWRIGIFLSVFDVHINRAPCEGVVRYVKEHAGACHNAMNTELASSHNQAVSLGMDCPDHPAGKVMVKQITGAIARRIVCPCLPNEHLDAGQKYGMIKFGSRTELFVPYNKDIEFLVRKGDTVRAGSTLLARYLRNLQACSAAPGSSYDSGNEMNR